MIVRTVILDKAAFFMTFGGKLLTISGTFPQCEFTIEVRRWVVAYHALGGWVPHNHYCNERRNLKRKSREREGLPPYFNGSKSGGFKLGDIVTYRPFTKQEKVKLNA